MEIKPVNEGTPQFQNFYLRNITCNGAAKGIFVRGIPEMHVKNIWIENAVLQADEGIDIQEASNINLNNVTMLSRNTNPVAYVLNSDNINITNLKYKDSADVLAIVQGERTKNVNILNTDVTKAKQKLNTGFGVTDAVVSWEATPPAPVNDKKKKTKSKTK
ncbi:hypothetical protein [Ferruginibacter sp.]